MTPPCGGGISRPSGPEPSSHEGMKVTGPLAEGAGADWPHTVGVCRHVVAVQSAHTAQRRAAGQYRRLRFFRPKGRTAGGGQPGRAEIADPQGGAAISSPPGRPRPPHGGPPVGGKTPEVALPPTLGRKSGENSPPTCGCQRQPTSWGEFGLVAAVFRWPQGPSKYKPPPILAAHVFRPPPKDGGDRRSPRHEVSGRLKSGGTKYMH